MNTQSQTMMIFNPAAFFEQNSVLDMSKGDVGMNGWGLTKKLISQSVTNTLSGILADVIKPGSKDAFALIAQMAGDMLIDYGVSEDNLDYYRFKLNPNNINVSSKKIRSEKFTGNGWDIDTRGETMKVYTYQGSTGSLMPELKNNSKIIRHIEILVKNLRNVLGTKGLKPNGQQGDATTINAALASFASYYDYRNLDMDRILSNPKLSTSYIKFLLFKEFWKWNPGDLLVIFEDDAYIGKFNTFNFRLDAENPYKIIYDFDLSVYPDFTYNMNTGYLNDSAMRDIYNKFVKNVPTVLNASADSAFLESVGDFLYNKNRIQFYNTSIDHSISNITPRELAYKYSLNSNIDILGQTIDYSFNLMSASNLTVNPTSTSSPTSNNNNAAGDKEYGSNFNNQIGLN